MESLLCANTLRGQHLTKIIWNFSVWEICWKDYPFFFALTLHLCQNQFTIFVWVYLALHSVPITNIPFILPGPCYLVSGSFISLEISNVNPSILLSFKRTKELEETIRKYSEAFSASSLFWSETCSVWSCILWTRMWSTLMNMPYELRRMCILLLLSIFHKCQLDQVDWIVFFRLSIILLIFCLLDLSITDRGMSKAPTITMCFPAIIHCYSIGNFDIVKCGGDGIL